ncbi:MAG: GNAT family N-acetyltransferase [Proteobacteria bacterium]|nr:GNAT family N-acetyltransferase [Pseudomonadota bacterium]
MTPPERFETQRLILRRPRLDDAEAIFTEYAQDAEVTRFLNWSPHQDVETTRDFLIRCGDEWQKNSSFPYAICLKEADSPIGMIHLHRDGFKIEFGYVMARRCWGSGYMTEALSHFVDWALEQSGIFRVWAFCDHRNPASGKVMEKAGMTYEGVLKRWHMAVNVSGKPADCKVYAKVK